jgi:hypothetical protein
VRRFDENDAEITKALREAGCLVWHLDCVEKGRPDKLVAFLGRLTLLEIKSERVGRLSKAQRDAHAEMARHGVQVHVVRSVREALDAVGIGPKADAERRRALGEIASGIRAKSDRFEKVRWLVSSAKSYRCPEGDPWADPGSASKIPDEI